MIVRDKPDVWDLLTALRGSIVPRILPAVLLLAAIATAVVALDHWLGLLPRLDGSAFTVTTLGAYLLHDLTHHVWDVRS